MADSAFNKLGAIAVYVEDVERSKSFYRDVVGLDVQFEDDVSAAFGLDTVTLIALQVDRASEQLLGEATAVPSRAGSSALLCAFIDDVDAAHAVLVERGVSFIHGPVSQPWGMRTASFKDPDGHVWELTQQLDEQ